MNETPSPGTNSPPIKPSADDVRAQLQRMIDSNIFESSPRRRDLLCFIVEQTLAGEGDRLKGYSVALAVFGREESFDPSADPVVRLEAGRLRRTLATYYVDAGKNDKVRITIPKGAYVPQFEWQGHAPAEEPSPSLNPALAASPVVRSHSALNQKLGSGPIDPVDVETISRPGIRMTAGYLLVAAILAVVAAGTWRWFAQQSPVLPEERGASIAVLPFRTMASNETAEHIAAGVTQDLVTSLLRFPDFRLYQTATNATPDTTAEAAKLGHDLKVAYVVNGSVQVESESVRVSGSLVDTSNGEIVWSGSFDRALNPSSLLGIQNELATAIATELGEPFGVVSKVMSWRLIQSNAPSMPSYLCILQAYDYRRAFKEVLYAPARKCLKEAVVRDPDYADAWAMLGWLHLDAVRQDIFPEVEYPAEMLAAYQAASHAIQLAPNNQRGLQALAAIEFANSNFAEAERLQRDAMALNPHDPEALAQLGWRLAVRGNWDEGIPLLEKAIARSVNPPGWYFHLISVHHYLQGDFTAALDAAQHSARLGSALGLSLAAISQAKLGNMDAARDDLAAMAEAWPLLAGDPAAAYRKFQADDQIVSALVAGLRDAGWVSP